MLPIDSHLFRSPIRWTVWGLMLCFLTCLGCGGGSDDLAIGTVSGKVTRNGQPVSGGSVSFVPIASPDRKMAGKPADGEIGADGTYKLSTYGKDDGAVIGKHRVTFVPPPGVTIVDDGQLKENTPAAANPFEGFVPTKTEVEVKAGANTIDIELVKGRG